MIKCVLAIVAATLTAGAPAQTLVLAGSGFSLKTAAAVPQSVKFGQASAIALSAIERARGAPLKRGRYQDCGQGTGLDYARYRGGLELTFEHGKFVGWGLAVKGDPGLRTTTGIGLGSTVAQLQKAYPNVFIDPGNEEDGGFGSTFQLDDGPNGFLDGARMTSKVTKLFAGAVCIVS